MLEDRTCTSCRTTCQGVYGRVVAELSGDPVAGALVTAFKGGGESRFGEGSAVTAADGSLRHLGA